MSEMFKVKVPFGIFGIDGSWQPNHRLTMSPEDQRKHNESIGVFPYAKQSTSWLADAIKNGLVKYE